MIRSCLKALAVALIVFPEPITTALGIFILSAALALPGPKRLDSFGDMEELARRSLRKTNANNCSEKFQGYISGSKEEIKTDRQVLDGFRSGPQYHNWFDNRRINKTAIHHVLRTTLPQYEADPALRSDCRSSNAPEMNRHAQLKRERILSCWERKDTFSEDRQPLNRFISTGKVIHHTLKKKTWNNRPYTSIR